MTQLTAGLRADHVRSEVDAMRAAVARVADRGAAVWTSPVPELVEALRDVARVDLCLARLVEGHADAARILEQAMAAPREGVYGVWASRSVGTGLRAARDPLGWRIEGELRFASGIDVIDRALVPVWTGPDEHLLVDLAADRVVPDRGTWATSAMDASRSFTVRVDTVVAAEDVVGPPRFYLDRPGFVIGGLGPAAVWVGGLEAVADLVGTGLRRFDPTAHQLRRLGALDQAAWEAALAVRATACEVDTLDPDGAADAVARTRGAVVAACDRGLEEAARIVGPGGLSTDARLARTLADLAIYVRQHHVDAESERAGLAALRRRRTAG